MDGNALIAETSASLCPSSSSEQACVAQAVAAAARPKGCPMPHRLKASAAALSPDLRALGLVRSGPVHANCPVAELIAK